MRHISIILIMIAAVIALISCEKEKITGKSEVSPHMNSLQPFNGVRIELDCDLRFSPPDSSVMGSYIQDSVYKINIHAQDNIYKAIETPVINGNLVIRLRENTHIKDYKRILIEVTAPDLSYLEMNGPGSVTLNFNDTLTRPYLDCTNSGTGTIVLHRVDFNYMQITLAGTGYIFSDSAGSVKKIKLLNNGSGRVNFLNIQSDTADVTVTGSGDVSLFVNHLLDGTITGGGNIYYKDSVNSGITIRPSITGSGKIIHL